MSSAVAIIRNRMLNSGALLSAVPSSSIFSGDLPINTVLPAIGIKDWSSQERLTVAMNESKALNTSTIRVTVYAKTYPDQKNIIDLARKACAHVRGNFGGLEVDSILPDRTGPDQFDEMLSVYMQSKDFIVKFNETM